VIFPLWEDHEVFSCQLKAENRASRLDHGVEVKLMEVVVLKRDGALVVSPFELNQFPFCTTVVAAVPSGS